MSFRAREKERERKEVARTAQDLALELPVQMDRVARLNEQMLQTLEKSKTHTQNYDFVNQDLDNSDKMMVKEKVFIARLLAEVQ